MGLDQLEQRVCLEIDAQGLAASFRLAAGLTPDELNENTLRAIVAGRNLLIRAEIIASLQALVADYFAGGAVALRREVARSAPPVHGVDGRFELDPALAAPASAEAPKEGPTDSPSEPPTPGQIDHRLRSAFRVVAAGQRLGAIVPPVPGSDGRDLFGKSLAAREGRAFPLAVDDSATVRPDGSVVAARAGVLELELPKLRVRSRLDVDAYVDFSTGNIDFPGEVAVAKGVRDGFIVRSASDLTVRGLVEAATMESGRDAMLEGGMAARGKGGLRVARDCRARYLDSVEGSIGRDLTISKELVNCRLSVGRSFTGDTCGVTGGSLSVAGASSVDTLGSESGVATVIRLGVVEELESAAEAFFAVMPQLEARVNRAQGDLDQLRAATGKLTATQAESLTELEFQLSGAAAQLAKARAGLDKLRAFAAARTNPELTVFGRLHAGVRISAGKGVLEVASEVKGPVKVVVGPGGEPRMVCPRSGEPIPAAGRFKTHACERPALGAGAPRPAAPPAGLMSDSGVTLKAA